MRGPLSSEGTDALVPAHVEELRGSSVNPFASLWVNIEDLEPQSRQGDYLEQRPGLAMHPSFQQSHDVL